MATRTTLTQAHREPYRRSPDERFGSLPDLVRHCQAQKEASLDRWHPPQALALSPTESGRGLQLEVGHDGAFLLNDWSFTQLCGLAGVGKDTVNRLSPATATAVLRETMPHGHKPLQVLTTGDMVCSLHGASYTRLWDSDLLAIVQEFATDFTPPQTAACGGGLYAGEQDLFVFLIDPAGWCEVGGNGNPHVPVSRGEFAEAMGYVGNAFGRVQQELSGNGERLDRLEQRLDRLERDVGELKQGLDAWGERISRRSTWPSRTGRSTSARPRPSTSACWAIKSTTTSGGSAASNSPPA